MGIYTNSYFRAESDIFSTTTYYNEQDTLNFSYIFTYYVHSTHFCIDPAVTFRSHLLFNPTTLTLKYIQFEQYVKKLVADMYNSWLLLYIKRAFKTLKIFCLLRRE